MGCKFPVCAGELRHYATILSPRNVDDGYGGQDRSLIEKGNFYCKVIETGGREGEERQRQEQRRTIKFYTRYRNDLRPDDIIVFECFKHNVTQVNDLERRHRWLEIVTERGEFPLDRIDIMNELPLQTFSGEQIYDEAGEAVIQNNNETIQKFEELNLKTFDGDTITTSTPSSCGV